ncbi:hypothetical protein NDU88_002293 [Pleurodeles waltl]|uniref:Uncharacterized protein n=1 Tax=Pleurodeles waltl TaxID=8319 RepID=A0AAV7M0H3_PLEWA|nr:hypothetical protein NDU88_002293 [Pleurodeles waltl]
MTVAKGVSGPDADHGRAKVPHCRAGSRHGTEAGRAAVLDVEMLESTRAVIDQEPHMFALHGVHLPLLMACRGIRKFTGEGV